VCVCVCERERERERRERGCACLCVYVFFPLSAKVEIASVSIHVCVYVIVRVCVCDYVCVCDLNAASVRSIEWSPKAPDPPVSLLRICKRTCTHTHPLRVSLLPSLSHTHSLFFSVSLPPNLSHSVRHTQQSPNTLSLCRTVCLSLSLIICELVRAEPQGTCLSPSPSHSFVLSLSLYQRVTASKAPTHCLSAALFDCLSLSWGETSALGLQRDMI